VLGLVRLWLVYPDFVALVDVAGTHHTDLCWTHPREPLQADHIGHDFGQVLQSRVHDLVGDGHHRIGLVCFRSAFTETVDRPQCLIRGDWDKLLSHRPLEHPLDPARVVIDVIAT
jgi:hypothetical protein